MTTYIFFLDGTLLAVVGIRHPWAPADHTAPLVRAVVTLITYAHEGAGPHVRITDHTFAITCKHSSLWLQNVLFSTPHKRGKAFWTKNLLVHSKTKQLDCRTLAYRYKVQHYICIQTSEANSHVLCD